MKHLLLPLLLCSAIPISANAQVDPGPRSDPTHTHAGGPLTTLSAAEAALFAAALKRFKEVDSVSNGLGPRFNGNSCAMCHVQPTFGGSSPATNPQIAVASLDGAKNSIPSFITLTGPVREARFVVVPDQDVDHDEQAHGSGEHDAEGRLLDGGVHDLFTITGRTDAAGCVIAQPDFAHELARNNVIFRIPTPLFGLGLVEDVPDNVLEANAVTDSKLGITPHFNHSGNDGTITKFGWKAQNKSLLIFAGEAYNVEQGVTNELFPNERETNKNCQFNATPEDATNLTSTINSGSPASDYSSDVANFADFMRLSTPPTPFPATTSSTRGETVFKTIGCAHCHVPTQTTHDGVPIHPYSDFSLHAMGEGLKDGIIQGVAGPDEFRTAP
ncbi:MAG TPA: di-heme oxidoredictase family protein, partial [Thermoanaerobaculia bacterium]|nr:di-heme oxidoredictase family protein [Thermoanaerobaculia bacterium]